MAKEFDQDEPEHPSFLRLTRSESCSRPFRLVQLQPTHAGPPHVQLPLTSQPKPPISSWAGGEGLGLEDGLCSPVCGERLCWPHSSCSLLSHY